MDRISSSFISNGKSRLSVLMVRGGKVLLFNNDVYWDAKNLLRSSAFYEKFEIIPPLTNRGYYICICIYAQQGKTGIITTK